MDYQEFVKARKNYIGASDASAIMGVSPWCSALQLWREKLGISPDKEDNWAMRRGRELEPIARDAYIALTGNVVEPKQLFHPEISYMMANFDGITEDNSVAVEIKCPGEKDHELAKEGIVPEKYIPQLMHQMAVANLFKIDYFSYRNEDVALIEVARDGEYIDNLYKEERKFWDCVENLTPPDATNRDFVERKDKEWIEAADMWQNAKAQLDHWKKEENIHKQNLITLSNNQNCKGNGVKLSHIQRKGVVDYSAIDEIKNVDIEKYRGPSVDSWRLTVYENKMSD